MLGALGYDYLVARPALDNAYDKIVDENTRINADPTRFMTNGDLHKLIGKSPSRSFTDKSGEFVEMFEWPGGLVLKTHKLYAYYQQTAGQHRFVRLAKHATEAQSDIYAHLSDERIEASAPLQEEAFTSGSPSKSSSSDPPSNPSSDSTETPPDAPKE
jgi:hypothetical protein